MSEDEWEKVRTLRASDDLWAAFGESCAQQGTDRSALLRRFMEWHSRHNPRAKRPTRPPEDPGRHSPPHPHRGQRQHEPPEGKQWTTSRRS